MLYIDPLAAERLLDGHARAEELITAYCSKARKEITLSSRFTPLGREELRGVLETSSLWLDSLLTDYAVDIPRLFIDFDTVFDAHAADLQRALAEANARPAEQAQQNVVFNTCDTLLTEMARLGAPLIAMQPKLQAMMKAMDRDHATIQATLIKILSADRPKNRWYGKYADILVALAPNPDPTEEEMRKARWAYNNCALALTRDDERFVMELRLLFELKFLRLDNAACRKGLTAVLDFWATLTEKYRSLVGYLRAANRQESAAFLRDINLHASRLAWRQIADYARKGSQNAV